MIYIWGVLQTLVAGYNAGNNCRVAEDRHNPWQYDKCIYLGALGQHAEIQTTEMLHFDLFVDKASQNDFLWGTRKMKCIMP